MNQEKQKTTAFSLPSSLMKQVKLKARAKYGRRGVSRFVREALQVAVSQ